VAGVPEDLMKIPRLAPALCLLILLAAPGDSVAQSTYNSVQLSWTAPGDDSLSGTADLYDLRYATTTITAANFAGATQVTGLPAPGSPGASQSFTVTGLQPSTTYWFAIKTQDDAGNWSPRRPARRPTTSGRPRQASPSPP
jgi:hypothetical protein